MASAEPRAARHDTASKVVPVDVDESDSSDRRAMEMDPVPELKIAVLGDIGVGKTALIQRFITGDFAVPPLSLSSEAQHESAAADGDRESHRTLKVGDGAYSLRILDVQR